MVADGVVLRYARWAVLAIEDIAWSQLGYRNGVTTTHESSVFAMFLFELLFDSSSNVVARAQQDRIVGLYVESIILIKTREYLLQILVTEWLTTRDESRSNKFMQFLVKAASEPQVTKLVVAAVRSKTESCTRTRFASQLSIAAKGQRDFLDCLAHAWVKKTSPEKLVELTALDESFSEGVIRLPR